MLHTSHPRWSNHLQQQQQVLMVYYALQAASSGGLGCSVASQSVTVKFSYYSCLLCCTVVSALHCTMGIAITKHTCNCKRGVQLSPISTCTACFPPLVVLLLHPCKSNMAGARNPTVLAAVQRCTKSRFAARLLGMHGSVFVPTSHEYI